MKLRAICLACAVTSCALLQSTPDDTPPEAPNAQIFRSMPPPARDDIFPPTQIFAAMDYINRLVCPGGDPPATHKDNRRGMVETYEVQCPGDVSATVVLDTAVAAPDAPKGMRLLEDKSFPSYRDAIGAAEKKDYKKMLAMLDMALKITPGEFVYRRERIYALYSLQRPVEALLEADDLLKTNPNVQVHRYRALSAMQLGMHDQVMQSLDGILAMTKEGNPIYAEAICTKGIMLKRDGNAAGMGFIEQGCALQYQACCDEIASAKMDDVPDAGSTSETDAGSPATDADAGSNPSTDAGAASDDAGAAATDAGSVPVVDGGAP